METKMIRAAIAAICMAAALPSWADTTIANNVTLTADADWRADGVVTVPEGVTVDLNGHTLWVSGLAGKGAFTSSVADPSTFDLTTADAYFDRGDPEASNLNSKRIIVPNANLPIIVDYDFGAATSVNSYKVYAGGYRGNTSNQNSGHERTAKHWKFYGSNDEGDVKTWTPLDERTVTDWNDKTAPDCKQFTFFNGTAYRYYRMEILEPQKLSNGHTELVQLEYGHVPNQVRLDLSQSVGFAAASNTVSGTARIVVAGGTLSANVDLRGLGKVTLDGNIDLNGCVVRAAALDGAGKVTSTFSDSGAFDLTTTQTDDSNVKSYFGDSTEPLAFKIQPAWKAFADYSSYADEQRVIDSRADYPKHIVYDFGTPTFIDVYKLMLGTNPTSAPKRAPKTIAFSGSNDGTTWTTLDSRPSETGWSASQERTYSFANERTYRYYRISFSASNEGGNIIEFFRLQYGRQCRNKFIVDLDGLDDSDLTNISTAGSGHLSAGDGVLSGDLNLTTGWKSKLSYIDGTIDLNGNNLYVSGLSGGGTITDSTEFDLTDADATRVTSLNTFPSSGIASAAFKNYASYNSTGQRVIANLAANADKMPIRIDYDFREATVVNAYRLTVGGNSSSDTSTRATLKARAPKSFSFWGSNEGGDGEWVKLDERTNETSWYIEQSYQEERQYEFVNETPYRRYRIEFYANNGDAHLEFFKLEYGNINAAGHLHVVVPSGSTVNNSNIAINGNLRLVKDGAGALTATKTGQKYGCGTEVREGTLTMGASGSSTPLGKAGTEVAVYTNAVVEMNAKGGFYFYSFNMAGGTIQNTVSDVANTGAQLNRLRLTSDSILNASRSYGFIGNSYAESTVCLNGHTLEVRIGADKYFYCCNTVFLDGTVDITSGSGWLQTKDSYVTATNVDFKINCALKVDKRFSVRDYEARFYSTGSNGGTAQMTVAGVFKPTVAAYYGCTMLAGSTMDLTAWPGAWPMASAFGANGKTDLEFADSGEITVNLAGRTDLKALARSADPHLFTWPVAEGVPVVPGAEFVLDPATASAGFKVKKDATGLRLIYGKGFMLIVK